MKKTVMNKRPVIYVLRLILYYARQPAQAGLQPLRHSGEGRNPVVSIIHSRKAGMTKRVTSAGREKSQSVSHPDSAFLDSSAACSRRRSTTRIHAGEPSLE